jgi:hypothetical protein
VTAAMLAGDPAIVAFRRIEEVTSCENIASHCPRSR